MPRIKWKKSELVDGHNPTFGTLVWTTHGPDELLRHERVSAVKAWVETLAPDERRFLPCLCSECTQEEAAATFGMPKRTVQRRVQELREYARRALGAVRP